MADPKRPRDPAKHAAAGVARTGARSRRETPAVDPNPQRVGELLAQIGTLGARLDAAAQHAVAALQQARDEPAVEAWDAAAAEALLELAGRIARQQRQLDAALERDRARLELRGAALAEASAPATPADAADAQATMDPAGPGMI